MMKNLKWVAIGAIILGGLFLVGSLTGANSRLFNLALDQLRVDRSRVVEIQAENQKWYEETIRSLDERLEANLKKQNEKDSEIAKLRDIASAKDAEIERLRRERENIITPSDPDTIIDYLHSIGYGSEHRRR